MKKKKKGSKKTKNNRTLKISLGVLGVIGVTSGFAFYKDLTPTRSLYTPVKNQSKTPVITKPALVSAPEVINTFDASSLLVQADLPVTDSANFSLPIATEASLLSLEVVDTYSDTTPATVKGFQRDDFSYYFDIGGNYTRASFKPNGNPSFKGNLGGAQGGFEYKPLNCFYEGILTTWKQGHLYGSNGSQSLLYIDVQERLGYTAACHRFACTLFTGLGYRHMGKTHHPKVGSSLKFRLNTFYIPVGVASDYAFTQWFSLGVNATWMPQVYPTISIAPLKGSRWILTKTLSSFSVSVPFNFAVTENRKFHIIVNPFYEQWKDGHSTAVTSTGVALGLPGNTFKFWGGELNFAYSF